MTAIFHSEPMADERRTSAAIKMLSAGKPVRVRVIAIADCDRRLPFHRRIRAAFVRVRGRATGKAGTGTGLPCDLVRAVLQCCRKGEDQ